MYEGNKVGVVVPAYNEQGFVGEVIDSIPQYVDRIYVVDDRSTDGTWREIRDHAERANATADTADTASAAPVAPTVADGGVGASRRVVPIRHEENRGVGGAIKTGYRRASDDGMDVTAVIAGDGQMDPDLLDRLLDPIVEGGADYAKGTRLLDPEFREDMPPFRLFGNQLLTFLTQFASGYWRTTDPQNGYTAISCRALDELDIESLYDDYGFANELLVRLNCHGAEVADVAIPAIYGDEESTIRYRTFVPKLSWLLLSNFCHRLRVQFDSGARTPAVGYALGALGLVAAVLAGVFGSLGLGAGLVIGGYLALGLAIRRDRDHNDGLETRVTDATNE
ncbi:glycosyltransferase family 2 protein [Halorussus limi]|uniref:Glycosyltransferase family 2 protein n=1 Tax=Halorussus limi TaxID=2938695 RepID=A0A8U0HYV4_9EURY|nr:glycosyltransferase family 2 protein [Halorussus limi]UPV76240.1 glycosyltransferase family 2 protein [Halorussus limi]